MSEKKNNAGCIIALILVFVFIIAMAGSCSGGSSSSGGSSGSKSGSSHSCYVCGSSGNIKYGSYYYCATHYAMVKTVVDAG